MSKHEQGIAAAAKALVDLGSQRIDWDSTPPKLTPTFEEQARDAVSAYLSTVLDEAELAEVIRDVPRRAELIESRLVVREPSATENARAVISHLRGDES